MKCFAWPRQTILYVSRGFESHVSHGRWAAFGPQYFVLTGFLDGEKKIHCNLIFV